MNKHCRTAQDPAESLSKGGQRIAPCGLQVEYRTNPLGIDALAPRLSWRLSSRKRGARQTAYQIAVTGGDAWQATQQVIWDTGKVASDQSTQIAYAGGALRSRQRYFWRVRIWDEDGEASEWSEVGWWEMGLLEPGDWSAQWIAPLHDQDPTVSTPAPMLRNVFNVDGDVLCARAYVTSLGLYELHLNGVRIGDARFTPGWTAFDKRLQYQVYDVSSLIRRGANAVGAILGDGWYRWVALSGSKGVRNNGKQLALLLQLEVTYVDGRMEAFGTSEGWRTATGPIRQSEIYHGEHYDARLENLAWTSPSFDDRHWSSVPLSERPPAALIASMAPPVRRISEIAPVELKRASSGVTICDMGQNLVGWVRLKVCGPRGTTITLRHAEILDPHGDLYTEPLRGAEQTVRYVLRGDGEECFEPHFTYQGFRYVSVEGFPGELKAGALTGVVIHCDMTPTGTLRTSSRELNQLHENIVWTLRSNLLEAPTDCPQRDERLGHAFDAQLSLPTAAFVSHVAGIYGKWLRDLAADQSDDGALPMEAPRSTFFKSFLKEFYPAMGRASDDPRTVEWVGIPGYADAITTGPWALYRAYGDTVILGEHYNAMVRWIDYVAAEAVDDVWDPPLNFGDWLDFSTTQGETWFGATPHDLMATAIYAHSVDIVGRVARILGRSDEADRHEQLFGRICEAFCRRFVTADGTVGEGQQTAHVLALDFDLLPPATRPLTAGLLAADVRRRGHLTTGIGGTQHLLNVLSRFGYHDEAYSLLVRQEMPSWLYQVRKGATTVWERWDGIREDGSFQDARMNSFNQPAFCAVGEWMYAVIGGIAIDPEHPGFRNILIEPVPGGGVASATTSYMTPYGQVSTSWRLANGSMHLDVSVPANATATVRIPHSRVEKILEGGIPIDEVGGILSTEQSGTNALIRVGAGDYSFEGYS